MKKLAWFAFVILTTTWLAAPISHARDLTFAERVQAQEAIEGVYYSHQIGTTKPFEAAVPRAVLEQKVRKYLKQTAALKAYWNTPVTAETLEREAERMVRQTVHELRAGSKRKLWAL